MSTPPTIQDIIDTILATTPYDPTQDTVDTVKTGDPRQPAAGIVTTFLASYDVIEAAIAKGANFIITHEPTFYNHLDETDWLVNDPIYQAKRKLIDDHGLVIWRFHDYWHAHQPDGIMIGVLRALGWSGYADADSPYYSVRCRRPRWKILSRTSRPHLPCPRCACSGAPARSAGVWH
jgi:putative NIF3 family GTP cyclohydrolase 1 type 2